MSVLNLLPVALAALGLVLRWYQFASEKPQGETHVAHVIAQKKIGKSPAKQPNKGRPAHVPSVVAIA